MMIGVVAVIADVSAVAAATLASNDDVVVVVFGVVVLCTWKFSDFHRKKKIKKIDFDCLETTE